MDNHDNQLIIQSYVIVFSTDSWTKKETSEYQT